MEEEVRLGTDGDGDCAEIKEKSPEENEEDRLWDRRASCIR